MASLLGKRGGLVYPGSKRAKIDPLTMLAPQVFRDYPMADAPMLRNSSAGRAYAGLEKYNTDTEKIFKKGGLLSLGTAGSAVTQEVKLPIVVQPDGTAIVPEIMKLRVVFGTWPEPNDTIDRITQEISLYRGTDYGCSSSDNLAYIKILHISEGVENFISTEEMTKECLVGTENSGMVVSENPTIRYTNTANYTNTASIPYVVTYKQRILGTPAYVATKNGPTL